MGELQNKAKIHSSCFIITINTNTTEDRVDMKKFESLVRYINEHPLLIMKWLNEDRVGKEYLLHLESDFRIEIGENYKNVHAHMLIQCRHTTKIQIDREKIDKFFKSNGYSIYCNSRYVDDGINKVLGYIYKGGDKEGDNKFIVKL